MSPGLPGPSEQRPDRARRNAHVITSGRGGVLERKDHGIIQPEQDVPLVLTKNKVQTESAAVQEVRRQDTGDIVAALF